METKSLNCTNCGAPLDLTGVRGPTMRCPYCNASVEVPVELRSAPPAQTHSESRAPGRLLAIAAIAVVVLALIWLALPKTPSANSSQVPDLPTSPAQAFLPAQASRSPTAVPTPSFASQVLAFGSQGIAPGFLNRATNIAVDAAGSIYVGDREGGRVQVFDSKGNFVTLWNVGNSKSILYSLAADRQGNVYAAVDGKIERHAGASGKLLDTLAYSGGNEFESIALTPEGGLVAMWYQEHPGVLNSREGVQGDLVQFDPLGKVTRVISSVVSDQTDGPERDLRLAVDGTGNIYAASSYSSAVFIFSREGKYLLRFGSRGEPSKPDQFGLGTLAVAIDGVGRAFVVNSDRILVFDSDGRYLATFGIGGSAYGIAIDDKNQIFVVKGNQVGVFAVNGR